MSDLRLNLGCGAKHLETMSIVDKYGESDLKFDLETTSWLWSDDNVVKIELCHIWQH